MKKIIILLVCIITPSISCKKSTLNGSIKSSFVETSQSELLYFDNDNIPDKAEIKATNNNEYSGFSLLIYLSTLKKTIEIPVYNNSILYNNIYADYYLGEPIIKDKVIELRIDYADKMTVANVSGEKKDLSEKIKYRFNLANKKIQIIGYDLSYMKDQKGKYNKSFNFITGKYYSSKNFNGQESEASGWSSEIQNIFTENWNNNFINKLIIYGNDIE
ncbi:hypothetical protein [Chryseobacterium sp.]|uniref:hypothetical protein n=1 Tax=Chryseobacterium sp. TaxID=1871047 RepID=UPI00289FAB52|nr:hypothetical protein [Chryseobacterium sp.]